MQNEKRIGIKPGTGDYHDLRQLFVGFNILLELRRLMITQDFPLLDRKDSNGLSSSGKLHLIYNKGVKQVVKRLGVTKLKKGGIGVPWMREIIKGVIISR